MKTESPTPYGQVRGWAGRRLVSLLLLQLDEVESTAETRELKLSTIAIDGGSRWEEVEEARILVNN